MIVELGMRKREMGMTMKMIWRIQADMRNQGCDMPDRVGKTSYWCNYMRDQDSYLLYQ